MREQLRGTDVTAVGPAQAQDRDYWMVLVSAGGVQAPYNFETQDAAELFMKSLANDPKIDVICQLARN